MANYRLSVLVSGGGTDLQSIIDAIESNKLPEVEIVQVISSKADAFALERAKKHGIKGIAVTKADYADINERMHVIKGLLDEAKTDLVVLAGYLSILSEELVSAYKGRIINIHPALLPKFGGKDCYGLNVHRQVLAAGEKESGATVHFVDCGIDTGKIILQKSVPVMDGDTPETLQERVLEIEHVILPQAILMVKEGAN